MKNLNPYNGNAYSNYTNAVGRKNESIEKDNLLRLTTTIEDAYKAYKEKFDSNSLHCIKPDMQCKTIKKELLSLYDYQNKVIREIKDNIKNQQIITIQTVCQNCTIDTVGTMDHILPKALYPEFAINAYNLFPCCNTCNQYKNDAPTSKNKKFLNLFLDHLPNEQYLFVDVSLKNNTINFHFYLDNFAGIDPILFSILENHYKYLHLFERFKSASNSYLSSFISDLKPHIKRDNKQYIIETTRESIVDQKKAYGYNYWKCILVESLINSSIFWNYMQKL